MNKCVTQVIEEVKEAICNEYCKKPDEYTPEEWEEVIDDICSSCPLPRL